MRGYFQASTATPTGFRPWNFGMQGLGRAQRPHAMRRMHGLGRLGVNMLAALPSSAQAQVTSIIQYLQQAQANINSINQLILQGNAAGIDMSAIAAQNQSDQNNVTNVTQEFTDGYRAMTGTVPPGLSGLGQVDPVSWTTIAGAAAALAIIFSLAYSYYQSTSANLTNAQANLARANTSSAAGSQQVSLQNQAAAAYASGDTATGDALTALAAQAGVTATATATGATASTGSWFTDPTQALVPGLPNWSLLAAAGFVVFLGPDILSTVRKAL